ncbi:GSCFA domain-containing protein [Flaviramulus sp. BrNp1-15]|uniref:GSCFA domain-containing protein n=1 Tax=Flaviramulus sp. BrNp1-15 TaxID=2916754 RepID=UPI001EE924CC|nr:GSCFA domain-containing protein [Flaviramulus sp. BrNp1-15]ULC59170.1 GSCFA domain-containing protein [Flaviramulus sp. BrNp1-15]
MNLQTQIPLKNQSENLIDYTSNMLLLGSCFSDNIGKKLDYFKFKNLQNPYGILFQPKAIETLIQDAVEEKIYTENDIFNHNEQWHCFDAHSKLSNTSKDNLLNDLNAKIRLTNQQIIKSTHIIITLGTAWVYRFKKTNKLVANCHKIPQKKFDKELLSVEAISNSLQNILNLIRSVNYKATVIFTVSPVRHLKDGFIENTQSKSHLISALHEVIKNQSFYFPSYEIMMDELRDYRFYSEDMIHPNETAINYIWEKFKQVWLNEKASKTMDEVDVIQKGIKHKPFNPNSEAHQKFLQKLEEKKEFLKKSYSHITF